MAWYDFIFDAAESARRFASDQLNNLAEIIAPDTTPQQARRRREVRKERRGVQRKQKKTARKAKRQPKESGGGGGSSSRPPQPPPWVKGHVQPEPYRLIMGSDDAVQSQYERTSYSSEREAVYAYQNLEESGVMGGEYGLLALVQWHRRRVPFVIYVRPS